MRAFALACAAFLGLVAEAAFGQPGGEGYGGAGPAPKVVTVVLLRADRGDVICEEFYTEHAPVTKTVTTQKDGAKKESTVTVSEAVTRSRLSKHELKSCELHTAGGKKLGEREVRRRLQPGTTLLIAAGTKPGARYLKALRDDTLILVIKSPSPFDPGAGPPPPSPRGGRAAD